MHPLHDHAAPRLQQDPLALGSVFPVELVIRHTRKWWDVDAGSRYEGTPLDFRYEVQALFDDWTIGGQKKGHFSAKVSCSGDAYLVVAHSYGRKMRVKALQFSSCHNARVT